MHFMIAVKYTHNFGSLFLYTAICVRPLLLLETRGNILPDRYYFTMYYATRATEITPVGI